MFGKKKTKKKFADAIIMNDERVSVEGLRKKAKHANTRFWGIAVSMGMVSSLVLPYMSMAAVAPTSSNVFTGEVIPGYSMGGVTLAAYGVDVNSWGKVGASQVVKSNYGVWSGDRFVSASRGVSTTSHLEDKDESANVNLTSRDRAVGWQGITGNIAYTTAHPDGQNSSNASNQYDSVAPYRTIQDYNYWDNQMVESNGAASAGIDVSLYADFIIVTLEGGKLHVLESPDAVNTDGKTMLTSDAGSDSKSTYVGNAKTAERGTTIGTTTATPYYISIRDLMDSYEIHDSKDANISHLMDLIKEDKGAKFLKVVDKAHNLLEGTEYTSYNKSGELETSNAFNPYPYSMVFSTSTDNGKVVSSIYENSECYVYFSPSSVYRQYMALKAEYEKLMNAAAGKLAQDENTTNGQDPVTVFQMGYYLAEMSILEAYLEEALPQDMTRGYVGPTETLELIGGESSKQAGQGQIKGIGAKVIENGSNTQPENLNAISYVSLMYDFSHNITGELWDQAGGMWRQFETDAIMDTLSTFGYNIKKDNKDGAFPGGTGVMKGINAKTTFERPTIFSIYQRATDFDIPEGSTTVSGRPKQYIEGEQKYAGFYTPTYYPIQQHKMTDSEKVYRFQILNTVPYNTLLEYIKTAGFSEGVKFSFNSNEDNEKEAKAGIESFSSITVTKARDKLSNLAYQYEHEEETAADNLEPLSSLNGSTQLSVLGSTDPSTTSEAKRVDAALLGYNASTMNSDNVHDLFDVVRATKNLKYETWIRFYNPIKSAGGDNDFFLTRISPAVTTYFPAILANGYTPAGGEEVDASLTPYAASFDYFSLPSFGPCFAAHTADTSYYGILNYELRPFYASNFIKTLSKSANVPAAEAYELAKEEQDELQQQQQDEAYVTNKNLACLYVLAKRVAYLKTQQAIINKATITKSDLQTVLERLSTNDSTNGTRSFTPSKISDINLSDLYNRLSDFPDNIQLAYRDEEGVEDRAYSVIIKSDLEDLGTSTNCDILNIDSVSSENGAPSAMANFFNGQADKLVYGNDKNAFGSIKNNNSLGAFDNGGERRPLLVKYELNSLEAHNEPSANVADVNKDLVIPAPLYFTVIYDRYFNELMEDTYYWTPWGDIYNGMVYDSWTPEGSGDVGFVSEFEEGKYNVVIKAGFLQSFIKETLGWDLSNLTFNQLVDAYEQRMDEASDEIAKSMINLLKDYKILTSTMPSKMQNCLAWADYQNSTDSEAQYQVDPSDANVTINVGNQNNESSPTVEHIRNLEEAEVYFDATPTDDGFTLTSKAASNGDGMELEGRLERGVEGTTWTSTTHPALYTITATIARVNSMSATTGTSYPYSGLANGRLQSGADKYALMQAHVIDYTSIASGIAGDLSTRQRAQIVSLVEPQYAAITDLTDIANILGGLMGEIGSAMIQGAADVFASVQFPSDTASGVATSDNSGQGMNAGGAASSTMAYMMSDGTTMNRTPASLATFNPNTGKLEYGNVYNNTSSNYIMSGSGTTLANAAGANAQTVEMAGFILTSPLSSVYKIIQTLALSLVLISIGYIAFRNFWSYSAGKAEAMIVSQRQLKTVIWRSIAAVFMIGLPPLAGGTGFEGGNFILLEVISNVAAFIEQIFVGDNGSAIMSIFTDVNLFESFGINFFAWILYFVCCAIMALCFLIGTVFVLILHLFLMIFFLFGPIVWALFVWPYNSEKHRLTKTLNFGFLSGGAIGNLAPSGHIRSFVYFSLISIAWGLIFWIIAQVFVLGAGVEYTAANAGNTATLAAASGYSQASMAISSAAGGLSFLGLPKEAGAELRLVFTTLVCVACFFLMGFLLVKAVVAQMKYMRGMGSAMLNGIKNGANRAKEAADTLGIHPGNIVKQAKEQGRRPKLGDAIDKDGLLGQRKGALAKSHKLKAAQKALKHSPENLSEDIKKTLAENGIDADKLQSLPANKREKELKKAQKKLKDAQRAASPLAIDSETGKTLSGWGHFKNKAKLAKTLGQAAFSPKAKNFHGALEGIAQTAAALNANNLNKDMDNLMEANKVLDKAKAAAENINEMNQDDLNGLDEATFNTLKEKGIVKETTDANGKTIRDFADKDKGAVLAKQLSEKIESNRKQIVAKQKRKDDVVAGLSKLGLSKDATLQEGLKVLKDGFDAQRATQLVEEHKFVDDADGTAMEKARKYMNDADYRLEVDSHESAVDTAMNMLGYTEQVKNGEITKEQALRQAETFVSNSKEMQNIHAIPNMEKSKQLSAFSKTSSAVIESLPDNIASMPMEDRAEFIRMATGSRPPAPSERQGIMEAVMNGTADGHQWQQACAMMAEDAALGRPPMAIPDASRGTQLAAGAIANIDHGNPAAFAQNNVFTRDAKGNIAGVKDFSSVASCLPSSDAMLSGINAAQEQAAQSEAFKNISAASVNAAFGAMAGMISANATPVENAAKFNDISVVKGQISAAIEQSPEYMSLMSNCAKRDELDRDIAKYAANSTPEALANDEDYQAFMKERAELQAKIEATGFASGNDMKQQMVNEVMNYGYGGLFIGGMDGYQEAVNTNTAIQNHVMESKDAARLFKGAMIDAAADNVELRNFMSANMSDDMSMKQMQEAMKENLNSLSAAAQLQAQMLFASEMDKFVRSDTAIRASNADIHFQDTQLSSYKDNIVSKSSIVSEISQITGDDSIIVESRYQNFAQAAALYNEKCDEDKRVRLTERTIQAMQGVERGVTSHDAAARFVGSWMSKGKPADIDGKLVSAAFDCLEAEQIRMLEQAKEDGQFDAVWTSIADTVQNNKELREQDKALIKAHKEKLGQFLASRKLESAYEGYTELIDAYRDAEQIQGTMMEHNMADLLVGNKSEQHERYLESLRMAQLDKSKRQTNIPAGRTKAKPGRETALDEVNQMKRQSGRMPGMDAARQAQPQQRPPQQRPPRQ